MKISLDSDNWGMTIAEQSAVIAVTLAKRQFMMALITISYNDCDVLLSLISYDMQRLQRTVLLTEWKSTFRLDYLAVSIISRFEIESLFWKSPTIDYNYTGDSISEQILSHACRGSVLERKSPQELTKSSCVGRNIKLPAEIMSPMETGEYTCTFILSESKSYSF